MKLKHKKLFLPILFSLLLFLGAATAPTTAKADTDAVRNQNKLQLYYDDIAYPYRGCTSNTIYIRVAKDFANRQILVEYKTGYNDSDDWKITSASFYKILDDNYSIYKVNIGGFGGITYKITATNGTENYIDDNNGANYDNSIRLGAANIAAIRHHSGSDSIYLSAAVKNISYDKEVTVHYTVDNWKTSKDVPLKFVSSYSPNFETWGGYVDIKGATIDNFQYCLKYTVNGETYWDNNFKDNYDFGFYNEY